MPVPRNALSRFVDQSGGIGPYEPTWREQIARYFVDPDEPLSLERERLLAGLIGSTGTGTASGGALTDMVPGVGVASLGIDASEALARGNLRRAAGSAAEMLAPVVAGRAVNALAKGLGARAAAGGTPVTGDAMYEPLSRHWGGRRFKSLGVENVEAPVRAYHGTNKEFTRFDPEKSFDGYVHAGTDEQANIVAGVKGGGNGDVVYPLDLDIKKTIYMSDQGDWSPIQVAEYISDHYGNLAGGKTLHGAVLAAPPGKRAGLVRRWLGEHGIDAIKYDNMVEGDGGISYAMVRPGTVRNAITGRLMYGAVPLAGGAAALPHMTQEPER